VVDSSIPRYARGIKVLSPDLDLWERQPDESEEAWHAFVLFRDNVEGRTISGVARTVGCARNVVDGFSRVWQWRRRVDAYDRMLDEQRVLAQRKAFRDMGRRHGQQATTLLGALNAPLLELAKRINTGSLSLGSIDDGDLFGLIVRATGAISEAQKLERLALGMPTDVTMSGTIDGTPGKGKPRSLVEAVDQLYAALGAPGYASQEAEEDGAAGSGAVDDNTSSTVDDGA
jgi:hypothetical protein